MEEKYLSANKSYEYIFNNCYLYNLLLLIKHSRYSFREVNSLTLRTPIEDLKTTQITNGKNENNILYRFNSLADLGKDIYTNGMYAPVFTCQDDDNKVYEGSHRVTGLQLLRNEEAFKDQEMKVLTFQYSGSKNSPLHLYGYDLLELSDAVETSEEKYVIIFHLMHSLIELQGSIIYIDSGLLTDKRKKAESLPAPSKFFTDEDYFKEKLKSVDWGFMAKENRPNIKLV